MEFEHILRLVETVAASGLTEFDYEEGNLKIHLGKKPPKVFQVTENDHRISSVKVSESLQEYEVGASVEEAGTGEKEPEGIPVVSPIVGVFYAAPGPEAAPFVKVGDRVEAGQVIGIVEAMKLMNEIQSDVSGIVTEICAQNGEGVEYGQPLIRVQE